MQTKTKDFAEGFEVEQNSSSYPVDAEHVSVDTANGIVSDNVQGALEELDAKVSQKVTIHEDLTSLTELTTTGLVVRTAPGFAATRSILPGSDKITVANGDGVAGNPTLDLKEGIIDDLLPSQTANSGKILSTDGTAASWIPYPPAAGASTPGLISAENNIIEGDLGSLTWNSNVSNPSGTTSKRFKCIQIGKVVHFWFRITHSVAGSNVTTLTFDLPPACPPPANLSNQENSAVLSHGTGAIMWDAADDFSFPGGCFLYKNFTGIYEIRLTTTWLLLYNIGVSPIDETMGGGAAMGYFTYFTT